MVDGSNWACHRQKYPLAKRTPASEIGTIMKNILWVSHVVPYPPKGGLLQRSYNLIKELSKYHNLTLVAFNQLSLCRSDEELNEAKNELGKFCRVADIVKIDSDYSRARKIGLIAKGLLPGNTYTVNWLASETFRRSIASVFLAGKFDAIHVDTISLYQHVERLNGVKKVLNHHNIESAMMRRRSQKERNPLKKFYFYQESIKLAQYERHACADVDVNITCSKLDIERLESNSGIKRAVDVPNGVDLDYFFPQKVPMVPASLVFAGSLSWYPNVDAMAFFFSDVWEKLTKRLPQVTITVVGANPPKWLTERAAADDRIKVTGFVDDVRPYIGAANIYICPIRDGGGTKLKVLDALAMGKVLVADPIACEGIDVTDGENVIFFRTPDDCISAIEYAVENVERASEIAANGRKLVERSYNFNSIGMALGSLYENL